MFGSKKEDPMKAAMEARQQLFVQSRIQLLESLNHKCIHVCITNPSKTLSASQMKCLDRCTNQYLESYAVTSNTVERVMKEDNAK